MKRFIGFAVLLGAMAISSFSCSCVPKSCSNNVAQIERDFGDSCFRVRLYSGGKAVAEYYTEYPNTMHKSDGWQFEDIKGRFIRLSGDIEIVEVSKEYCRR